MLKNCFGWTAALETIHRFTPTTLLPPFIEELLGTMAPEEKEKKRKEGKSQSLYNRYINSPNIALQLRPSQPHLKVFRRK